MCPLPVFPSDNILHNYRTVSHRGHGHGCSQDTEHFPHRKDPSCWTSTAMPTSLPPTPFSFYLLFLCWAFLFFSFVSTIVIIVLWRIFILAELKSLLVNSTISMILMSFFIPLVIFLILGMMSDFSSTPWIFSYYVMRPWILLNLLLLTFSGPAPAREVGGHCLICQMKGEVHVSHSAFIDT